MPGQESGGTGGPRERELAVSLAIALVILYAMAYLLLAVDRLNSPEPSFLGISTAMAYSIIVWLGIVLVLTVAFLRVWR